MLVLITYDVNTSDKAGCKRLREIAKICVDYGQRVQNSVFECVINPALFKEIQHKLLKIIKEDKDSIRFYYLGDSKKRRVEHYGIKDIPNIEGTLIV